MSANKSSEPFAAERLPGEEEARWWQRPLFSWVVPLINQASDLDAAGCPLEQPHLLPLPSFEQSDTTADALRECWVQEKTKASVDGRPASLGRAMLRAFGGPLLIGVVLSFFSLAASFAQPIILREMVLWLSDDAAPHWKGFVFAGLLPISALLYAACFNHSYYFSRSATQRCTTACCGLVYEAVLRYPAGHRKTADVLAAYNADCFHFMDIGFFLTAVFVTPVFIAASVVTLYLFVGFTGLIAVALMLVTLPFEIGIMSFSVKCVDEQRKAFTVRVGRVNEALQGIRICKFMNWEARFESDIAACRDRERAVLGSLYGANAASNILSTVAQQLVTFFMFWIAYALPGSGDALEPQNVFPALALLAIVRQPLVIFPLSVFKLLEVQIPIARIQALLDTADDSPNYVTSEPAAPEKPAVSIAKVTVIGDNEEAIARDLSAEIPAGQLTVVVGATASGKSTLISALIGEANVGKDDLATCVHRGAVAYVPQDPWIRNATLQDNITFGTAFDTARYDDTLRRCQLVRDLQELPAGDQTEIGERGVNLSGGQRQRVALARAVYSGRDIVVMDDPLSAVDPHVCQALFHRCIRTLPGTRVLVTHQVQFLRHADQVIVMEDCAVAFRGSFDALAAHPTLGPKYTQSATLHEEHHNESFGPTAARDANKADDDDGVLVEAEGQETGAVGAATYLWYGALGGIPALVVVCVGGVFFTAATVFFNLILAAWTGGTTLLGDSYDGRKAIAALAICTVLTVIGLVVWQIGEVTFFLGAAKRSHGLLFGRVLRAPMSFFDTTPLGRITNRFTKDMTVIDLKLPEVSSLVVNGAFLFITALVIVACSTVYIVAFYPLLIFLFVRLLLYYASALRGIRRLEGTARSPMVALMTETLAGLASIRAFGIDGALAAEHLARVSSAMRPTYCAWATLHWTALRMDLLGAAIMVAAGLFAALAKATDGGDSWAIGFSPTVAALALTNTIGITQTLSMITRSFGEMESFMSSTERVKEYSDAIPQERDVVYSTEPGETPAPPPTWPADGSLRFRDVQLRYRDNLPFVLKGVSFDVPAGAKVGIVGRTGSGKSTLMLALFRMVELASGSILISGADIAQLSLQDLRQQITIIPQDPLLFEGSVRSNLDPFGDLDDDAVWAAVDRVGLRGRLTEFIAVGPTGLDAPVAEKGGNFSVGQRQLLCLARALLKKSKVLLLDEATASVDFEADALIQRTIRTEFAACTVLTIAHRLATVADSDRVLVLGAGSVLEYGLPSDLLRDKRSHFRQMAQQLGEQQFADLRRIANKHSL